MSPPEGGATSALAGCKPPLMLKPAECERYVAWLFGETGVPDAAAGLRWALAHCDDGVTWGRFDAESGVWCLGSDAVPDVSPRIRWKTLQELRIFGPLREILIWRTDAGFRGRQLSESEPPADRNDESDPLRPSDEPRIVRGSRTCDCRDRKSECRAHEFGFTHVVDGAGAEQVLPIRVTTENLRTARVSIEVSHYYERDAHTGAVRIAATRLVDVGSDLGGRH